MWIWQIEECLSLPPLLGMVQSANARKTPVIEKTIAFGHHPQQSLLLCQPPAAAPRRKTVIFFVPGGGWRMGSAGLFRFIGRALAVWGFPTIVAGYRLAPAHKFPVQLADTCLSLQVGLEALEQCGVATERVVLGGQSAGAQLASLLAYAQHETAAWRQHVAAFSGLLVISGPVDFSACRNRTIRRLLQDYLGDEKNRALADPIRHIRAEASMPVLCMHGDRDPLVELQNARSFAGKVNEARPPQAQVHLVSGGHHSDLVKLFLEDSTHARVLMQWLEEIDER
jgi:acetyl esterase/lipase